MSRKYQRGRDLTRFQVCLTPPEAARFHTARETRLYQHSYDNTNATLTVWTQKPRILAADLQAVIPLHEASWTEVLEGQVVNPNTGRYIK